MMRVSGGGGTLTTHLHPAVPSVRMTGTVLPLPLSVFTARVGNLYLI
jgi:hypothetical protein